MEESREQKFRRECEDLHAKIEYGLYRDINRIIRKFPDEKYFYNDKKESAAAVALKHKHIEIYRLLISKGVSLGPHEDANKLTSKFNPRKKKIIQENNKKNSIEVADHISILMSKSKIFHNVYEREISEMEQCIRKAFIDLDQVTRIQPILKIVAYAGKPSINFDFYDHKISNMDPTSKAVRGCCYSTGKCEGDVFIESKDLMRADEKYFDALGMFAHELSHYAMQLVYQNHCKPYKCSQDNEDYDRDEAAEEISDEDRFSDVCKICEENCKTENSEPCINVVFQYPELERHAELIVRVPQLLVFYKNDETKLSQIESNYFELFNYFDEKILANIESMLSRIKPINKSNQAYQSKLQKIEHYVERKFIHLDSNFEEVSGKPTTNLNHQLDKTWEEKLRRECENLHANIEYGLDPDIDRIFKKFPDEKHFYNDKMESAVAVALKHKQIKIYSLLISKGLCLGPHEDAYEITRRFDPRMKQIILEINMKNSIEVADHILILISKSKISQNACESEVSEMEDCIRQAFIDLNRNTRIQPILKIVAYAGKLSTNFDFYDDKISNMNPMKSKAVRGCCYLTGRWEGNIFFGAKGLMRTDKEYLGALGTLAHQLSHYAMQLVYQNDCKPYKFSHDKEKEFGEPAEKLKKTEETSMVQEIEKISDEKLFSEICKKCEENCKSEDTESCMKAVFEYPETQRHAELIVRVPQLLVLHKNDDAKLSQIELTYFELFNYFEEKILANIESVLPRIKPVYKLNQAYQSKHQNIEHYVERKFIRLAANFKKVSEKPLIEDQLIDLTEKVEIILLSDESGAGKTTNLIAIAGKLKIRYPDRWIVVIDLKEFADCYKRDEDESTTFRTIAEIENYYCEKIFKFKNLEAKNFAELFEDNRVIFLMDGFDEISPSYKEFNLKLIKAIARESDNRIWISTRPHLEKELQGKLNCSVFRLKPFTIEDRRNFLELKWKSEIDQKTLNEKIQKVENILNEIIEISGGLDPTSNPLILKMITEVVDELPNQENSQMNLYSIYETFVNKKMKIFFKKGPEAEEQMIDPHYWPNIKVFHYEIALVTLFGLAHENMNELWPLLCERTNLPSPEDVARLGLMVYVEDSSEIYENFRFVHRTFAEYFVADFIFESFSKFNIRVDYGTEEWFSIRESLEETLSLCTDSKGVDTEKYFNFFLEDYLFNSYFDMYRSPTMVRHFIYSFWKTRSFVDSFRNKKLQNFVKALNSSGRFFRHLFHAALRDGSDCFFKNVPVSLEVRLRSAEFWKPWEPEKYSAMILSAKHSSSFFLAFLEIIKKFLDRPIWRKMFFDVDVESNNILWHCSLETFKLILSDSPMIPLTRQEKEELFQHTNKNGLNVLLYYVTRKSKEEFKKYYEVLNDFDEEMPDKLLQGFISSEKYQSILHYCLIFCDFDYFERSLEIVREFFELSTVKEMFKIKDGFPTLLMLLPSRIQYLETFKTFWNFFEEIFEDEAVRTSIMLQESADGFSAFDSAFFECAGEAYNDLVTYIKQKYEIVYSKEEMKQKIMRNISSISETHKADSLRSKDWRLGSLMENVILAFPKDFVRSLFLSCDGKPISLKDERTIAVLKPLLIEKKIFSDDEMDNLF